MAANAISKDPGALFDIGTGLTAPDATITATGRTLNDGYVSDAQYRLERESIFGKAWLHVARTTEVPSPGDFVVKTYLGLSMLVVRGLDGKIRVFHNVCTHRAAPLVVEEQGRAPSFTCQFHAWCFSADGTLIHVPDRDIFPNLDIERSGLAPINCDIFGIFVFINLQDSPKQSLTDFLGDWGEQHRGLPWEEYGVVGRMSGTSELNWKLGVENGTETYHAFQLHKHTLGYLIPKDNPFLHQPQIDFYGPHGAYTMPGNPDFTLPPDSLMRRFVAQRVMRINSSPEDVAGGSEPGPSVNFATHPGINLYQSSNFGSSNYIVFPNTLMVLSAAGWHTARYWPLGPGKTYWEAEFSYLKPRSWSERFSQIAAMTNNRDAFFEDTAMGVAQQTAMRAGAVKYTQFNAWSEMLPRHHEACVAGLTRSGASHVQEAAE